METAYDTAGQGCRLLFSCYHCYLDPSSGAMLSTRDLLELLTGRGWDCRVLCGPRLDYEAAEAIEQLLSDHQLRYDVKQCSAGTANFSLFHFVQGGVPVTIYKPSQGERGSPPRELGLPYLALLERVLEKFRPDVLLTYGGDWLARQAFACARHRGVRVVFSLRNFAYKDATLFKNVTAVHVPSRFAQDYYQRTLGLTSTPIPGPWNWERVLCPEVEGRYVTFVNPQPHKGVFVFSQIAAELGRQRPDIPFLVVEGRAQVDWLARTGLDFGGMKNLYAMANTPDPRDFYRVSRLVLMPSLWNESFPRVAAEALINGIPVLGTRRGGLPEALDQAGFLFDVPERYTPESRMVPTAEEVAPWIETIIRLWDDAELYVAERKRCLAAAAAWTPERLAQRYEEFLAGVLSQPLCPSSKE